MKTLILYYTKWGSTKQYCQWIAETMKDATVADITTFNRTELANYERIVIGSYVYAGKIMALNYIQANWEMIKDKGPVLFTVGMLNPNEQSSVAAYENIPEQIRSVIKYVKLPGQIKAGKLNFFEKLITKVIKPSMMFGEFKKEHIKGVTDLLV